MRQEEDTLLKTVRQTISHRRLLCGGEKVLIAVSGGADSLCLLHLLWRLQEELSLSLHVGHVNHLLRGEEAAEDARHVEEVSERLGLTADVIEVDVKVLARKNKLSIEDAGRQARYQALEEMAERTGAGCIALGHTADDQVETILLNFLRGGGPEGLAGMPVSRELSGGRRIIRPLIEVTKAETEAYCEKQGLVPRLDATNLEMFARRNRIRHELLPMLRKEQPALEKLLLRQAEIFRAEDEFLRNLAEAALRETTLESESERIVLSIGKLNDLPLPLGRRVVREALRNLRLGRLPLSLDQVERVLNLAHHGSTGKRLSLGDGLSAEKEYERLLLSRTRVKSRKRLSDRRESGIEHCALLQIPGEVEFAGQRLEAEKINPGQLANLHADEGGRIAFLDAARIGNVEALAVRFPRPGDRFIPLGAPGQMKLSDFFINRKVPRPQRSKILLVCCEEKIAWVVGHRIDDRFKVTNETQEILRLELLNLAH
jgi:tRNA(Ile)-lysidine synthase